MIHLLTNADEVLRPIHGGPALLLLDYDGTLRETTENPAAATLSPTRRALLARLAAGPARVAVMSGRPVGDLKRMTGPTKGLVYCGNFGLEIEDDSWSFVHPRAHEFEEKFFFLREQLADAVGGVPRLELEDKRWGLVVHYRGVAAWRRPELDARLDQFRAGRTPAGLRWTKGDMAWEILPDVKWDKGDAAELLWKRYGKPYVVALGDGPYDEAMFALARGRGAAICVGRDCGTQAPYWLKDVREVYRFLSKVSRRRRVAS